MNIYDIILKKRDGYGLSQEEIYFWVQQYTQGAIPDYQCSALLMAIFINGLTEEETNYLTTAMVDSGQTLDLSSIEGIKVDKHSSGGVGDKTSLIVAPILAAAGLKVAKMSDRGLGHTGGTLDKLESIPGFKVALSIEDFMQQVKTHGIAIVSQTADLVPADKKIYELRDATATVNSIPLIAASIMSKKIATGADNIVLDVKYGKGAFMPNPNRAINLAQCMIKIGAYHHKKVTALITAMDQPLGMAIGNALEVDEAISVLKGEGPKDLKMLSIALAGELILQSLLKKTRSEAYALAEKLLINQKAWRQFLSLVEAQGGNVDFIKTRTLTNANYVINMGSFQDGYISGLDAMEIGNCARALKAGRIQKEDEIDPHAGILLHKKVGDFVEKGEVLATIYANDIVDATEIGTKVLNLFQIQQQEPQPQNLIFGILDQDGFTAWADAGK